ncbi:hypothetical protein ACU4GD_08910 [Cupriavidus basilensis]
MRSSTHPATIDLPFLNGFRQSAEHAEDARAVIAWMRGHTSLPVWLAGTSRGTQSVAAIAIRLADGGGPDGIVLTSTILREERRPPGAGDGPRQDQGARAGRAPRAGRLQALPVQRSTGTDGQARQDAQGRPDPVRWRQQRGRPLRSHGVSRLQRHRAAGSAGGGEVDRGAVGARLGLHPPG